MSPAGRRRPAWWPTPADVADAGVSLATTTVGLAAAIAVVSGVRTSSPLAVLLTAVVVAVGALVVAPLLRPVARFGGAGAALLSGIGAQLAVAWAALAYVPGMHVESGWSVVQVLVLTGLVMAAGRWLWAGPGNGYVVDGGVRRARRAASAAGRPADDPDRPAGLLVVQLDGVAAPVLEQAMEAGLAPTMQRWVVDGSHRLEPWWARLPATTPASQAGLLYGDSSTIPAFRWWDRELGRLVVANHPADAAAIEAGLDGRDGLLADGGVAVSTMFSGDAPTGFLVMSRTGRRRGLGPGQGYLRFFTSPFVLVRALTVTVGEMAKELYQARRQREHGVHPRVSRGGWYVPLRALTNVLLRDLITSIVAEALARGVPTVFVDLVDYDEVAHHAGPTRPEALRALEGLDGVLGTLERVLAWAPRRYRVVVLSDHGQSLGATYEQVEGRSLLDTVRELMAEPDAPGVTSAGGEDFGPLTMLLTRLVGPPRRGGAVAGPDRQAVTSASSAGPPEVVVTGSGNLGLVWFPRHGARLTLEDLQELYPGLVAGLAGRPGVGVVVVDTRDRGLVAVGEAGVRLLEPVRAGSSALVDGTDPVLGLGPRAAEDLARAGRLPCTGDLMVVSAVTASGHVHAFEGQVGSHGGLGGAQSWPFLLHPVEWEVDESDRTDVAGRRVLVGAELVHAHLVRWARSAGVRR